MHFLMLKLENAFSAPQHRRSSPWKFRPERRLCVTPVKVDRSCASAASAAGSPTASLHSCAKLVRCSRPASTDVPDTVSVELEHRERLQVTPTERSTPCQQPKLAIAQLASLASISTAATATQQIITTTVVNEGNPQAIVAGETRKQQPPQTAGDDCGSCSSASQPPEVPCSAAQPAASSGATSPTPSTSTAVAAPRRICTLKVKIFLIKHLSKLVACNKKMFLPVKSNT
uniref:Uncharacterized protein n=1 Tax=Anopheles culicifacies TaxID=139723 RepID=A0A182LWX1_9DIPT